MLDIKNSLTHKYDRTNCSIYLHGRSYLQTAKDAHSFIEDHPDNCYPILTLIGISIELFFKSFDITDKTEKYNFNGLVIHGQHQTETNNKNGHNLKKLFEHLLNYDSDLYEYLSSEYSKTHQKNLSDILNTSYNLFQHTRYIYENTTYRKYLNEFNDLLNLNKFLYDCMDELFNSSY